MTLYGENVKRVDSEKYLGWTISGGGLSDCAYKTVLKRRGNVRKAISQIKSVIEDSRCKVLGGIDVALQIWNLSVSPFLYYSSENWIKIEKKTLKILTDLQCEFYRAIFGLPSSSPKPILFFDTKGLLPENMVMKRKLLFYFHLEHLPPSSLAAEILSRQKEYHLNDSLYQECQRFLCLLGLSHPKEYSKQAWKKAVNQVVNEQNRKDLLTLIKDYKKLSHEELKDEDYEVKSYIKELPLQKARTKMRHRSQMLKSVKFNFQSDKEFASQNWQCKCGLIDSQNHIEKCILYADLRVNLDLSVTEDLVDYFDAVLKRREQEEDDDDEGCEEENKEAEDDTVEDEDDVLKD